MFGDTFPPIDWYWWGRWCYNGTTAMSVFLGFEGLQARIGVVEGLVHVVWGESVSFNLCEYEIFCHFEDSLGHGTFLGVGG
jgi:hypothetical protein